MTYNGRNVAYHEFDSNWMSITNTPQDASFTTPFDSLLAPTMPAGDYKRWLEARCVFVKSQYFNLLPAEDQAEMIRYLKGMRDHANGPRVGGPGKGVGSSHLPSPLLLCSLPHI